MSIGVWTREEIEQELRDYRAMKFRAEEYADDLRAYEDLRADIAGAVEGAAMHSVVEPGMPRSGTPSDTTGRLALCPPDEVQASAIKIQLRVLERRIRRVERWMAALTNRERTIIKMIYADGMVWGEVVTAYNLNPTDGLAKEERTLRRWRRDAIERIVNLANIQNVRKMAAI